MTEKRTEQLTARATPTRPPPVVPHLSVDERVEYGKACRREVPRSDHAHFSRGSADPDPVTLLERQATSRVPELVPIRYGRMLVSPFTFYRGAALVMASDLAGTPRSGLSVQLCGDAHLMNFGVFGSPERRLVFDINDLDETAPGPFEWDVKRLAASFAIAGRENGCGDKERERILLALVGSYRTAMRDMAGMTNLAVWYAHLDAGTLMKDLRRGTDATTRKRAATNLAKARTRDSLHALDKLTEVIDGQRRIISEPPLIEPIEEVFDTMRHDEIMAELGELLASYRRTLQRDRRHLLESYRIGHVARKVVGVGSVGTRAWVILMFGRDSNDPLILQAKEAQPSVLEQFTSPHRTRSNGERVVDGQHLMQETSDIFLGWDSVTGADGIARDYYVRQLRDWKGSAIVETMTPDMMEAYGRVCGWTLARAHARSGDRIAIASYLGNGRTFDHALAQFAETYADQTERDYDDLVRADQEGRITVKRGL